MLESLDRPDIAGGFAFQDAPFASHPNDAKRACLYFAAMHLVGGTLDEIEADARAHLERQGCSPERIWAQVASVRELAEALGF